MSVFEIFLSSSCRLLFLALSFTGSAVLSSAAVIPDGAWEGALAGRDGVFVILDAETKETFISDPRKADERAAPCSTFKIWNSLIGLEEGIVTDPDAPFWKWDGKQRFLPEWNKDQTLRSAIASSCVPAYQSLARKIGSERMQKWLDAFDYGNRDISAGIDVFWLPDPPNRRTILISPLEQARLLARLVRGQFPVSSESLRVLGAITTLKTSPRGTLHGKTGTGIRAGGGYVMGWFVGWVEHGGKTHSFACLLKGEGLMGKDARDAVETTLVRAGFL